MARKKDAEHKTLTEPFKHNGFDYFAYHQPTEEYLLAEFNKFIVRFTLFCKDSGFDPNAHYIDVYSVTDAIVRTDQRKLHYLMYHGIEMNELKWTAVFCYWLIRHKAIARIKDDPFDINERFVAELMFDAVAAHTALLYKDNEKKKVAAIKAIKARRKDIEKDLLYALTYRVSSYDELTMMLELLSL